MRGANDDEYRNSLDDVAYEVSDLSDEGWDLRFVEVDAIDLEFHTASPDLIQEHFPEFDSVIRDNVPNSVSGAEYLATVAAGVTVLTVVVWLLVRYLRPKRVLLDTKQSPVRNAELRPNDALMALRDVSDRPHGHLSPLILRSISHALYKLSSVNYAHLEALLTDYCGAGSVSTNTLEVVGGQVLGLIKQLETQAHAGNNHSAIANRGQHVEDRVRHFHLQADQYDILVELELVRDALRNAAVLSGRRHTEAAVQNLKDATDRNDVRVNTVVPNAGSHALELNACCRV
jgi:hypothetical protein